MNPPEQRSLTIDFAGQPLDLLPDRAVWWPTRKTLLIADVHFGKCATFRALGVPVPAGQAEKDLARMSALIEQTAAPRLVILGDLLHGRLGRDPEMLDCITRWRTAHATLKVVLVRGNHDRSAGPTPAEWAFDVHEETLAEDGVSFCHAPPDDPSIPTFAGHVHPVVALRDYDRSIATAPCFVCDARCLVLPSFGTFTGGHPVERKIGRRIFVVSTRRPVVELIQQ